MTRPPEWSEAEIVVLCAIFVSSNFSIGDDERPECKLIAKAFGRTPSSIDMQWRNVKAYLANLSPTKIGYKVKVWSDVALNNPKLIKTLALHYCCVNQWDLHSLLEKPDGNR